MWREWVIHSTAVLKVFTKLPIGLHLTLKPSRYLLVFACIYVFNYCANGMTLKTPIYEILAIRSLYLIIMVDQIIYSFILIYLFNTCCWVYNVEYIMVSCCLGFEHKISQETNTKNHNTKNNGKFHSNKIILKMMQGRFLTPLGTLTSQIRALTFDPRLCCQFQPPGRQ